MPSDEIDLVRKHLPKEWALEYRIVLVDPAGGLRLLSPSDSKRLTGLAYEAEVTANRLASEVRKLAYTEAMLPEEDPDRR